MERERESKPLGCSAALQLNVNQSFHFTLNSVETSLEIKPEKKTSVLQSADMREEKALDRNCVQIFTE